MTTMAQDIARQIEGHSAEASQVMAESQKRCDVESERVAVEKRHAELMEVLQSISVTLVSLLDIIDARDG